MQCMQCAAAAAPPLTPTPPLVLLSPSPLPSALQHQNYACAQMRAYYKRMSVDGPLRAAVFAEIEVDAAEVRC